MIPKKRKEFIVKWAGGSQGLKSAKTKTYKLGLKRN